MGSVNKKLGSGHTIHKTQHVSLHVSDCPYYPVVAKKMSMLQLAAEWMQQWWMTISYYRGTMHKNTLTSKSHQFVFSVVALHHILFLQDICFFMFTVVPQIPTHVLLGNPKVKITF